MIDWEKDLAERDIKYSKNPLKKEMKERCLMAWSGSLTFCYTGGWSQEDKIWKMTAVPSSNRHKSGRRGAAARWEALQRRRDQEEG